MKEDTKITAYCNLCGKMMLVTSIEFGIDQILGMWLECGHPKSFSLIENDLSALHDHIRNMEKHYPDKKKY